MQSRLLLPLFFALLLFVLSARAAWACLVANDTFEIRCSNVTESAVYGMMAGTPEQHRADLSEALWRSERRCREDFATLIPALIAEAEREGARSYKLVLTQDAALDQAQQDQRSVADCDGTRIEKMGNWFLIVREERPYCVGSVGPTMTSCGPSPVMWLPLLLVMAPALGGWPLIAALVFVASVLVMAGLSTRMVGRLASPPSLGIKGIVGILLMLVPTDSVLTQLVGWLIVVPLIALWLTARRA